MTIYYIYLGLLSLGIIYCILNIGNIIAMPGKDYRNYMILILCLIILSSLSYIFEATSITIDAKMIAIRMEFTVNACANIFFLFYMLRFCDVKVPNGFRLGIGAFHILCLICLYTTEQHGLFYSGAHLLFEDGFVSIALDKGALYVPYIVYCFSHMIIYSIPCFWRLKRSQGRSQKLYLRLLIAGLMPFTMYLIYETGFTGPFDITCMGFLLFAVLISDTIKKFGLGDIVSIAKDKVIGDMNSGILITDEVGYVKYINPAANEIFEEVGKILEKGKNCSKIRIEDIFSPRNGKIYTKNHVYDCSCIEMTTDQILVGKTYILHEITEMEKLVRRDSMTGLYNHAAFFDLLEQGAERCNFENQKMAIAFIDIDDFKKVNDTFGHSNGDIVLLKLTEIMKHHCYDKAYPCRYGGEEFAIIFEGDNAVYAKEIMESILNELSNFSFDFCKCHITFSCAVCHYQKGIEVTEFFSSTDKLLYEVKRNGKNQVLEKVS